MNNERIGLVFFFGAGQFILILMLGEAIAPGYNMHSDAISNLGVIAETRLIFNSSLLLIGICNAVGAFMMYKGKDYFTYTIFNVASLGIIGTAIFPLNHGIHGLFALTAFIFVNLEAIFSSKSFTEPMKTVSRILGGLGLIALILHILGDLFGVVSAYGPWGHGGSERLIVYPVLIWMISLGGYQMGHAHTKETRSLA